MTQLLFAMLPCYADREGRMEDRPKRIKASIFPYYEADVDAMLQNLADSPERFIVRYEIDGKRYLQITNFEKHQSPHHKEEPSTIHACPNHESSMSQSCREHDSCSLLVTGNKNKNKNKNPEGECEGEDAPTPPAPDPFDQFWSVVHAKTGKQAARSAYGHAVKRLTVEKPDRDPHEFLRERMAAFAATPNANPPDRSPIHPSTWLNMGRYDDDPATWQRNGRANGSMGHDPRGTLSAAQTYLSMGSNNGE